MTVTPSAMVVQPSSSPGLAGTTATMRPVAAGLPSRLTAPAQVALASVIRRQNVVAIPGASSVDQLVRNAEAADLDVSDSEDAQLGSPRAGSNR
jgi:aryl-alcohol dehydrogenase-like predicted oxidoreductase